LELADLAEVWETHGKTVLTRLAVDDPGRLAAIAYGLLPKDIFVQVQQTGPGGVSADAWALMRPILDLIPQIFPAGSDPAEVLKEVQHSLRSSFAKQIEGK